MLIVSLGENQHDMPKPISLRKHAYSNIEKILPPKTENFHIKKLWYFFTFSAQNINMGTR